MFCLCSSAISCSIFLCHFCFPRCQNPDILMSPYWTNDLRFPEPISPWLLFFKYYCNSVIQTYCCTSHLLPITTMTPGLSREIQLKASINHLRAFLLHHQHLDSGRILSYFLSSYAPTLNEHASQSFFLCC